MHETLSTKREIKDWAETLPLVQQALPVVISENKITLMIKVSLMVFIFYPKTMRSKIEKRVNELLTNGLMVTVKLTLNELPGLL
jgi:hypothetical protein